MIEFFRDLVLVQIQGSNLTIIYHKAIGTGLGLCLRIVDVRLVPSQCDQCLVQYKPFGRGRGDARH
jgi:hypothetical protein